MINRILQRDFITPSTQFWIQEIAWFNGKGADQITKPLQGKKQLGCWDCGHHVLTAVNHTIFIFYFLNPETGKTKSE